VKRCAFCAIASGDEPAHFVLDEPETLAFLDKTPLFSGHVLVIPRVHVETLSEVDVPLLGPLFSAVQRLARAVPMATGAQGTFVAMNNLVSQSVPHLHVHVVPRTKGDGLKGFFWPRRKYGSDGEMQEVAAKIRGSVAPASAGEEGHPRP
jgi:histidine triad (HIT) family protein